MGEEPAESAFAEGFEKANEPPARHLEFVAALCDLCNRFHVGLQGDPDDAFATLYDLQKGEHIVRVTIGHYGALEFETEDAK